MRIYPYFGTHDGLSAPLISYDLQKDHLEVKKGSCDLGSQIIEKKIKNGFTIFHTLWTNENETWKIENLKNPRNRFSTYAEIIGCNKKIWGLKDKILHHEITKI